MAKKTKRKVEAFTAAQLQKFSDNAFKDAFKNVQQVCQQALMAIKPQMKENLAAIKEAKLQIKALEQETMAAKNSLANKKTQALQNKVKKLSAKMKEANRNLVQLEKQAEQFTQESAAITAFKNKEQARGLAAKDFDQNYQSEAEPKAERIEKTTKTARKTKATKAKKDKKLDFNLDNPSIDFEAEEMTYKEEQPEEMLTD